MKEAFEQLTKAQLILVVLFLLGALGWLSAFVFNRLGKILEKLQETVEKLATGFEVHNIKIEHHESRLTKLESKRTR